MKRYSLWNKKDNVITPSGAIYTPEEYMQKHPAAALDNIQIVLSAGDINGAFYCILSSMVDQYTSLGCDFSDCSTDEEKLNKIEEFLDNEHEILLNREPELTSADITANALASIAASLEYQNLLTLSDNIEEE